ncbi:MAG: hypothetical protein KJ793_00765 [Candidatus Omnitrophica bacterium]|nr:hypothetical protein [Candidatus Omnitrophota bacterium]
MLRCKKAQSILEYVVMFTVVVGAILAFVFVIRGQQENTTVGLGKVFYDSANSWSSTATDLAAVVN